MNLKKSVEGGLLCFLLFLSAFVNAQSSIEYDIVLSGGRVIDPETKLDTIKNIGIINNRIAEISSEQLKGKEMINASGLVVAPGFIDLHVHGRGVKEQEYKLHDGVTTMLELEWGIEFLDKWYESRQAKSLINYGASVCWPFERFKALGKYQSELNELFRLAVKGDSPIDSLFNKIRISYSDSLSPAQTNKMLENIRNSLAQGGIGIGVPIGYLPAVKEEEVFRVYQLAGELKATIFTHVR